MNKFNKILAIGSCLFISTVSYAQADNLDPKTNGFCETIGLQDLGKTIDIGPDAMMIDFSTITPEVIDWCNTHKDGGNIDVPKPEPDFGDGMIIEGGFGGLISGNKPILGATQTIQHDIGLAVALSLLYPVYTKDDWVVTAGGQLIGGRTPNKTLINVAPFPASPFGGTTQYGGILGVVGIEKFCECIGMFVGAYGGLGFSMVDLTGIQGGVTTLTGRQVVPTFKAGIKAFKPLGNGFEIGGGLDFTMLTGFNTVTNTGVTLNHGAIQDIAASITLRYKFGGPKQRLGLARPLLNDPQSLLLDEPLSN